MILLTESLRGRVLLTNHGLIEQDLVRRILNSDILISDLDDTVAPSPAETVVLDYFKNPKNVYDMRFLEWFFISLYNFVKKGVLAKPEIWKNFVKLFLSDSKELEMLRQIYTPEFAKSTLYRGVLEFYSLLPETMIKIYITENIKVIADAYRQAAGFDEVICEPSNKAQSIDEVLEKYAKRRSFVLVSDFDDLSMFNRLSDLRREGRIRELTSINVVHFPYNFLPYDSKRRFDVNIRPDYVGLVTLIDKIKLQLEHT